MNRLAILLLFAAACTSTTTTAPAPQQSQPAPAPAETRPERSGGTVPIAPRGVSCNSAVVVDGTNGRASTTEDQWLAENYPGAKVVKRSTIDCKGKPVEVVEIATANGQQRSVYFAPVTQ